MHWTYAATVVSVYDGDTFTVDLDMGMRVWQKEVKVRIQGIDAPEVRGAEKPQGIASRDALRALLPEGKQVKLDSHQFEKYGRLLCEVWVMDDAGVEINVGNYMLGNGYATVSGD